MKEKAWFDVYLKRKVDGKKKTVRVAASSGADAISSAINKNASYEASEMHKVAIVGEGQNRRTVIGLHYKSDELPVNQEVAKKKTRSKENTSEFGFCGTREGL